MNIPAKATLATAFFGLLLAASLFAAPSAQAVTQTNYLSDQGGAACQLSVPTTSSKVRPRASGMRNEGTTNEFVICQFTSSAGFSFNYARLDIVSTDGKNHTVQCTGMSGVGGYSAKYSTKTFSIAPENYSDFLWLPADFASVNAFNNRYFSATCNLPPGTSIIRVLASYELDVGA